MVVFNAWYYSFSPYVANYLSNHWVERTIMKGVLYPLVGILYLTSELFSATSSNPEVAVLLSGLFASTLIGTLYLGLPLSLIRTRVGRRGRTKALRRLIGVFLLGGLAALFLGEVFASPIILMVSSSAIILSTLFLAALETSGMIARTLQPES
jgi:RsiW-degrading membrane proteinase PrsW (M82 family)